VLDVETTRPLSPAPVATGTSEQFPPTERPAPNSEAKPANHDWEDAMADFDAQRWEPAAQRFDAIAASSSARAREARLMAARAVERARGCPAARERYEEIVADQAHSPLGQHATWLLAKCHLAGGDRAAAEPLLTRLLEVPAYAGRAKAALHGAALSPKDEVDAGASPPTEETLPPANSAAE